MIDPLETPTVTPVQDEENVTKDNQSTASGQGIGMEDAPSSQDKCRFPTFTSPSYRQEEIASQGEPDYPSSLPELLSCMPGNTPRATPKPSPRTTPKPTPQTSPSRPSPTKPSVRGHIRGTGNSPSGRGWALIQEEHPPPREWTDRVVATDCCLSAFYLSGHNSNIRWSSPLVGDNDCTPIYLRWPDKQMHIPDEDVTLPIALVLSHYDI